MAKPWGRIHRDHRPAPGTAPPRVIVVTVLGGLADPVLAMVVVGLVSRPSWAKARPAGPAQAELHLGW